jgi:hypothetical protein
VTRLLPQAAARHPCGLRLWILAIHPGPDAPPDAAPPTDGAVLRLPACALPPIADASPAAQRLPRRETATDASISGPLHAATARPCDTAGENAIAGQPHAAGRAGTPAADAAALAPPAGWPPPAADAPDTPLLLHTVDAGLVLLVADGPPGPGPGLLLTLVDQADRAQGRALLPDPPPADPSAALASAPRLGLALLAAVARDSRLAPLAGWLAAWAAALPAATGEALADPAGHVALRLPPGTSAPLALLPRPDGGLRPAPLPPGSVLDTPTGLLLRGRLAAAPAAIVVMTADGPARLAVARCARAALDQAVAAAIRRLAPDHAGILAPMPPAAVPTDPGAPAERPLAPPAPATPQPAQDPAGRPHPADARIDLGAGPRPEPQRRPRPPRPAILLAAGVESPFARRLLFLLAQDLAREVAEILLFGADPRAEAAWLRPRFPIPVRAAPPLWQARARAALAQALLLPIGPAALAALAAGDAAALHARATEPGLLLALADALGDDEAAVLQLAGDAP